MGHPSRLTALVLAAALFGCQSARTVTGHAQRALRPPGEKLAALPERVADEYGCARVTRPFVRLERVEVVPDRVRAGGAVNHRLVYALCPARTTDVVRGALVTRVLYAGQTLMSDRQPRYELKPGRWIVDATIEIPATARTGVYAIEVQFEGSSVRFRGERAFAVAAARRR
jgi:hypothetical protein